MIYRYLSFFLSFLFEIVFQTSSREREEREFFYTSSSTFCTKKWNEAEEGGTYSRFPGERVRNLQIFAKMERRPRRRRDGRRLLRVQSYNFDKLPSVETNEEKRAKGKDFVLWGRDGRYSLWRFIFHDGWCYNGSTPEEKNFFFFFSTKTKFDEIKIMEKSV